jgi:hypothetical protein
MLRSPVLSPRFGEREPMVNGRDEWQRKVCRIQDMVDMVLTMWRFGNGIGEGVDGGVSDRNTARVVYQVMASVTDGKW